MKKLIGGAILAAAFTVAAIVYLTGVDEKTALAPYREVGFGDAGAVCGTGKTISVDAGPCDPADDAGWAACPSGTISIGVYEPCPALACREATVRFDARAAEAARLGDPAALVAQGGYGRARVCGDPDHGLPLEELPEGTALLGDWRDVPFAAGYAAMALWIKVPFAVEKTLPLKDRAQLGCFCGPGCLPDKASKVQGAALAHVVLTKATAPDAGACASVPCVMLQGERPEMVTCCAWECASRSCGSGLCGGSCGQCAEGFVCLGYACSKIVVEEPEPDAGKSQGEVIP